MTTRRQVRVTEQFFSALDQILPPERTTGGVPSATDFLLHDLPPILDRLAVDYEAATMPAGTSEGYEVRVLVTTGILVARMAVYTTLAGEDTVAVFWIDMDDLPAW